MFSISLKLKGENDVQNLVIFGHITANMAVISHTSDN